jgi:tetratricopeptide (TPR) repeat protein
MYRVILCAAAALLVTIAVQPAKTDDKSACNTGHDADEVIAACSRRLTLYPRDAVVYSNRGSAYTVKGDYDRAIADLDQAIRLDPKLARPYNNRGEAYEARNDPDHAIADFDQALKLNPAEDDARRGRERVQALLAKRSNNGAQTNAPPR